MVARSCNGRRHFDFSDQSMFYASYAVGSKAGNVNLVSGVAAAAGVPTSFKPEDLTSYELGTKNTFLDGTLQANGDFWYYDYKNFQYTVVRRLDALHPELQCAYVGRRSRDDLAARRTLGVQPELHQHGFVDQQRPVRGRCAQSDRRQDMTQFSSRTTALSATDFPGGNCVMLTTSGIDPASDPNVTDYYAVAGVPNPFIAPFGTAAGAASLQNANPLVQHSVRQLRNLLRRIWTGLEHLTQCRQHGGARLQLCESVGRPGDSISGIAVPLAGKKVLNLPPNTVSVGGQYTFNFDGYTLVPRVDYYWQSGYFSRIFNDPVDSVGSWDQLNLQMQLNAPDARWYAKVFATNVMGQRNITGLGPQSDTSGVPTHCHRSKIPASSA